MITVFGSINLDLVFALEALPGPAPCSLPCAAETDRALR